MKPDEAAERQLQLSYLKSMDIPNRTNKKPTLILFSNFQPHDYQVEVYVYGGSKLQSIEL